MASQPSLDRGYFVDSDDECEIESEAEPRERYAEGSYYPVQIGEILHSRYRIEHKLGWGGYSTVWLAHDAQQAKKVALKIMTPGQGQAEHQIQRQIYNAVQDSSKLVLFQSVFFLPGSSGYEHMVLVYPVRGPNLRDTLYKTPAALRMAAAKHLLLALKSLHDAGFVHKDLSSGNVMWHIQTMDHWPTEKIYQQLGRPRKLLLGEAHLKPGELVEPMQMPASMTSLPVYLGDFGLSFRNGNHVDPTVQFPLPFCAPESSRCSPELCDRYVELYGYVSISLSRL
ncbi:hypothetical protein QQS21_010741 [Conoideocrella luteorostrata]|uniref:non-specific serine/threonine protein kinase n=1 Tax=Conoideocrella luteorostrata TaxID=1105319 RepID=A0AAJ0CEL5_9HYPO|nr:hypothetical protein QQS21_010741 [Conoideocrella luteorostrata]